MTERTIPILPCRDLDDVIPFYEALGFAVTYRQERPNPYVALNRGGLDLHFFGLAAFDPAQSLGNVIVQVPDAGAIYDAFAAGLRAHYGKLPVSGLPRITRPRRKQGTSGGFSVVDPGGNWLRVSSSRSDDEVTDRPAGRLDRVLLNAARQGDAHGDDHAAISVLEAGLTRHPGATALERLPVLAYLAELFVRTGNRDQALRTITDVHALDLDDVARAAVAAELSAVAELEADLRTSLTTRGG